MTAIVQAACKFFDGMQLAHHISKTPRANTGLTFMLADYAVEGKMEPTAPRMHTESLKFTSEATTKQERCFSCSICFIAHLWRESNTESRIRLQVVYKREVTTPDANICTNLTRFHTTTICHESCWHNLLYKAPSLIPCYFTVTLMSDGHQISSWKGSILL